MAVPKPVSLEYRHRTGDRGGAAPAGAMYLPVIFDEQAQSGTLGTCTESPMALYSCYVCSAAMVACYFGHDTDPGQINDYWRDHGLYVRGCLAVNTALPEMFGDLQLLRDTDTGVAGCEAVSFESGEAGIVHINGLAVLGYADHYLALDHCAYGRVYAGDPWWGDLCDVEARYGNVIENVIVYRQSFVHGPPDEAQQAYILAEGVAHESQPRSSRRAVRGARPRAHAPRASSRPRRPQP